MTDRPILFSAPMVRALLDGRKTQTRRVLTNLDGKGRITEFSPSDTAGYDWHFRDKDKRWHDVSTERLKELLRWHVGDRLWVREAWRCNGWASDVATIFYRASEGDGYTAMCEQWPVANHKPLRVETKWSPSLHLPRWASRLTLTVTDVRVQRLQECSEADALAEGAQEPALVPIIGACWSERDAYAKLWDHINGAGSWAANPWVAALTFTVERRNIDAC